MQEQSVKVVGKSKEFVPARGSGEFFLQGVDGFENGADDFVEERFFFFLLRGRRRDGLFLLPFHHRFFLFDGGLRSGHAPASDDAGQPIDEFAHGAPSHAPHLGGGDGSSGSVSGPESPSVGDAAIAEHDGAAGEAAAPPALGVVVLSRGQSANETSRHRFRRFLSVVISGI